MDAAGPTSLVPSLASVAITLLVLRRPDLPARRPMLGLCACLALWHGSDFGVWATGARGLRLGSAVGSAALVPFLVDVLTAGVGRARGHLNRALALVTAAFVAFTLSGFAVPAVRRFVHSPSWAFTYLALLLPPMLWAIATVARVALQSTGPAAARARGLLVGAVLGVGGGVLDLGSMASRAIPAAGAAGTIAGVLALAWTLDSGADADRALPTRSALLAVAVTSCAALLALALTEMGPLDSRALAAGGAGLALLGLAAFRLGAGRLEREALRMRSLALLGTLSAELAHEVRNPLAAIRGEVQRLAAELPPGAPDDLAAALQRIDREVDRLDQVVRDYGALARGRSVRNEKVDVSAELRELLALHRRAVPRNVEVKERLAEGLPRLRADADRLRAVVLNLVRNALLAMPEGGVLTVTTRVDEARRIVVEVGDTGVGIAPRDLRRIFEPLFTTRARGTGLGLTIARRIAEEHGGSLEVDSVLGRGSTFRVALPLDEPPPPRDTVTT